MSPDDLKYTASHEWVRVEADSATVGITAHAVESLSDLVFLDLPSVGDDVTADGGFGEIESVKAVSDLKSPVSGTITDVNDGLADNLSTINQDPYGDGWLIKVKLSGAAPEQLMEAAAYDEFCAQNA